MSSFGKRPGLNLNIMVSDYILTGSICVGNKRKQLPKFNVVDIKINKEY